MFSNVVLTTEQESKVKIWDSIAKNKETFWKNYNFTDLEIFAHN